MPAAKLLLERGADVNATDDQGKTPRLLVDEARHPELAELLDNVMDVNVGLLGPKG